MDIISQRIFFEDFWNFENFFGLWAKIFWLISAFIVEPFGEKQSLEKFINWTLSENFLAALSKLDSTYTVGHFGVENFFEKCSRLRGIGKLAEKSLYTEGMISFRIIYITTENNSSQIKKIEVPNTCSSAQIFTFYREKKTKTRW